MFLLSIYFFLSFCLFSFLLFPLENLRVMQSGVGSFLPPQGSGPGPCPPPPGSQPLARAPDCTSSILGWRDILKIYLFLTCIDYKYTCIWLPWRMGGGILQYNERIYQAYLCIITVFSGDTIKKLDKIYICKLWIKHCTRRKKFKCMWGFYYANNNIISTLTK